MLSSGTVRPTDLRGILQYVPQFRDRTFVVAVDGAAVADENFGNILMDAAVLWSLRIRTVLVHGASVQISALADERGVVPSDLEGSGVTDAATLDLALTASNRVAHEILEGLNAADLRAAVTNAVIAHPLGILKGVDHLFTGRVERVDVELLQTLLANGIVPVVPPLGMDGEGRTFRVNSDSVALEVAKALSAVKLVYMTTERRPARRRRDRPADRGRRAGRRAPAGGGPAGAGLEGPPRRGRLPRRRAAGARHQRPRRRRAARRGLLERGHRHARLRQRVPADPPRARGDVRAIEQLIRSSMESEELAPRTRAMIERELADYYIFEVDKNPIACVALHLYPEEKKGELACLYVRSSHENQGIGRKMTQFVEAKARELGVETLLALSTQAFNYFQSKAGFTEGTPDDLPPARRARYDASGRRSKVLLKLLAPPAA